MSTNNVTSALEALLFVSDEPTKAATFSEMLEIGREEVTQALEQLAEEYERDERGFQLRKVAGGWRLFTNPAHHEIIERYILSWDTRKLSQAALETLAIIAYHQPVTRGGVNSVRGVSSEGVISSLIEKGLVREAGRDKLNGNAILYATTRTFLEKFGLGGIEDLPLLSLFAPEEAVQHIIKEQLGMNSREEQDGSSEQNGEGSGEGFDGEDAFDYEVS